MYDLKMTPEEIAQKAEAVRNNIPYEKDLIDLNTLPDDVVTTEERFITTGAGETHIYIHRPAKTTGEPLPLLIYIHGGAHIKPYRETDRVLCRIISSRVGCVIVDIDYKLAPEYPYPIALNECYDTVMWAIENAKELNVIPEKLALIGNSAGGNLVAALAIMAKDRKGFKPLLQVLDYPVLDLDTDPLEKSGEMKTREAQRYIRYIYIHKMLHHSRHPYVSPVFADEETIKDIAPALIITAQHDNLLKEAEDYAMNLIAAGVPVTVKRFKNSKHAFLINLHDEYKEALDVIVDGLKKCYFVN